MSWCPNNTTLRPIVGLSAYVVEKMPVALATNGINMNDVAALASKVRDRSATSLARLDAKMLEMALLQSGQVVPDWLTKLVDELSADRPRGILYEEIVIANPEKDMRTFTTGKVGATERRFYHSHVLIEDALDSALKKLSNDAETLNPDRIEAELKVVVVLTGMLVEMPDGHFDSFRPYLGPHPKRNTKGPSGLFSPGMAELQLRSGFVPPGFIDFLHNNLVYYPVQEWPRIQMALHEFEGNNARLQKNPALAAKLRNFWSQWRKVHLVSVSRQVPGVGRGTGGEANPITFLKNRMNIRKSSEE